MFEKFPGFTDSQKEQKQQNIPEKTITSEDPNRLPDDYWFRLFENIAENNPNTPIAKKAMKVLDAMGLPVGEASAVGPAGPLTLGETAGTYATTGAEFSEATKREKIIWETLAGHPGVKINGALDESGNIITDTHLISIDPRDTSFNDGKIPDDLREALGEDVSVILDAKIAEQQRVIAEHGETHDMYKADMPIIFFRLPGGANIIPVGYVHHKDWHTEHREHLAKMNKHAGVIVIEGYFYREYGVSLDIIWGDQSEHFDALMRQAVAAGFKKGKFKGKFLEIDPRDNRDMTVLVDGDKNDNFPNLPEEFIQAYQEYLEKEDPNLAKNVFRAGGLEKALRVQSTTYQGVFENDKEGYNKGLEQVAPTRINEQGDVVRHPTGLELGGALFSNAVSAIRLHMIAKLQGAGKLPMGPVLDYQGSSHLPGKNFFIRYPLYAMEVILRNPHFALIHTLKEGAGVKDTIKFFENPDYAEILRKLGELPFHEVEDDESKTIEPGPNQRKLVKKTMNFWDEMGIDPKKAAEGLINS